ncbi:BZ3500_MvSof-1268-A1-R1_Chr6-1g08387 [Microbotryum saponariae]|uniref:BZ3500_MvSof-1268-A1-R1_Chr6-1g08387 protein n=1 Tax=Microbotryum saponariae TaxID=289078 RepID=A0A2X0KKH5_9BASI|nr:BZ3500_MvSof-1268-A1-R1_Chr6-1g08387 [Microbotryum saponariae]SDA07671.1 BZ3501_MvSof-1269-A2-R1_Chr6-1g08108 [Microbotryum saponariae]
MGSKRTITENDSCFDYMISVMRKDTSFAPRPIFISSRYTAKLASEFLTCREEIKTGLEAKAYILLVGRSSNREAEVVSEE